MNDYLSVANALKIKQKLQEEIAEIDLFLQMHHKFSGTLEIIKIKRNGRPSDFVRDYLMAQS